VTAVWLLPEALGDVEDAFLWYEEEDVGLGMRFLQAVQSALDVILEFPDASPLVYRGARRYLVERFPHCMYYRCLGEGVVVVALLHAARDPELGRARLRSR
jgi:plasmid stabilization system protein ParE